ncbi:MerR family transcriptional regulator [Nitratifractor sp.]
MALKMRDLVRLTGVPKSTILYYIKEGLLPEPEKPKPNVHLYDERFVERIAFIRYLQTHFRASIEQIRAVMRREDFDPDHPFASLVGAIDTLMAPAGETRYDREAFCEVAKIDCATLSGWIDEGLLFERDGGLSDTELEMARILKALEATGHLDLAYAYRDCARDLVRLEAEAARSVRDADPRERDRTIRALLDATLLLKPYILNLTLYDAYRKDRS